MADSSECRDSAGVRVNFPTDPTPHTHECPWCSTPWECSDAVAEEELVNTEIALLCAECWQRERGQWRRDFIQHSRGRSG